jgi:hypothetical protein
LLRYGHFGIALRELCRGFFSDVVYYGMALDTTVPIKPAVINLPLSIREYTLNDMKSLQHFDTPGITGEGILERLRRLSLLKSGTSTCYAAFDANNKPYHMLWFIGPEENGKVQSFFNKGFPLIADNEMLVEATFTLEPYRGQRIMGWTIAELARKYADHGIKRLIMFVRPTNTTSLRAAKHIGFEPYIIRQDRWRIYNRSTNYKPLTEHDRKVFLHLTGNPAS